VEKWRSFVKLSGRMAKRLNTKRENEDNPKKSAEKWRSFVNLSGRMAKRLKLNGKMKTILKSQRRNGEVL
jgi:hypothetical protein